MEGISYDLLRPDGNSYWDKLTSSTEDTSLDSGNTVLCSFFKTEKGAFVTKFKFIVQDFGCFSSQIIHNYIEALQKDCFVPANVLSDSL